MKWKRWMAIFGVCFIGSAQADTVVGYWDLNTRFTPQIGSASLAAELNGVGILSLGWGTGTSVNLEPGYSAGESIRFLGALAGFETGTITLTGLNFSGLTTPTISFAARSNPVFEIGDQFDVEYDAGSGWSTPIALAKPGLSYSLVSHTFGSGLLDNVSDAKIRITFSSIITVADVIEVDNVRVSAVPEPTSLALLVLSGLGLAWWRSARAKRAGVA